MYGIARQAGGVARIESELGKGTTVEMWLPLVEKETQEIVAGSNLDNRAVEGRHILVIEDDEDVRSMLVECLQALRVHRFSSS